MSCKVYPDGETKQHIPINIARCSRENEIYHHFASDNFPAALNKICHAILHGQPLLCLLCISPLTLSLETQVRKALLTTVKCLGRKAKGNIERWGVIHVGAMLCLASRLLDRARNRVADEDGTEAQDRPVDFVETGSVASHSFQYIFGNMPHSPVLKLRNVEVNACIRRAGCAALSECGRHNRYSPMEIVYKVENLLRQLEAPAV